MTAHVSLDPYEQPDGWFYPKCSCGWTFGAVPDIETLVDALMQHAAEAATS